jgi:uncharacterized protein
VDVSEESRVFHCRCCGNCCRWEGIVRYVPQEGAQIARFLGISEDELIQRYTRLAPDRKGLVFQEQPDGACIFLTPENRCAIHPVKPQKCRDYPYRWQTTPEQQYLCQGRWSGDAP